MTRVEYFRYGGPEAMYLSEFELPQVRRRQVRVAVKAAAINPFDWKLRRGAMKLFMSRTFPKGMGCDFAGVVEAVGRDVTNVRVGDAVFGSMDFKTSSAFAEQIVLDARLVARKPAQLSFGEAACLPIPAMTAWAAVFDRAHARPGSRIFINGCRGAVGTFAVQLARAQGAYVSGSCGRESMDWAKAAGVDPVLPYADMRSLLHIGTFDAVFDTVGTLSVDEGLSMLKPNGVFIDINPTARRVLRGVLSRRYKLAFATMGVKHLAAIGDVADKGILRPTIGLEAPFSSALSMIAKAENGSRVPGRTVLLM